MLVRRRDLALGAAAVALFPDDADAQARGRNPIGRYPAPVYKPSPPGTSWIAPRLPVYPQPNVSSERLIADAQALSTALEGYIRDWLDGKASERVPERVLPPGWHKSDYPSWRLLREDQIRGEDQWAMRPAHPIDRNALHGGFPDPNCTYLVAPLYAPFGSTLIIDGDFPHARFFDVQVTPSFDPKSYRFDGWAGVGEVPIVDADIDPLPGHTNPYRIGAQRDAEQRGFRLEWAMSMGDPVELNAAFRPPFFRAPGNSRIGGGIMYQGPYADRQGQGHRRGRWDHGSVWVRYYRPDSEKGAMGGVAPPKMTLQLADGRRFWLQADFQGLITRANRTLAPRATSAPTTELNGPKTGWSKQAGILSAIYAGFAISTGWGNKSYVRDFDRGAAARGTDLPPPNNYEQSATSCTYIDYLVRSMESAKGKVVVLTGRLPKTPRTRGGAKVMEGGEARYWSLTSYVIPEGWDMLSAMMDPAYPAGLAAHCVMDEDVVLQEGRRYVIAMSRPEDRPVNATPDAGVTWVDWGLAGTVSWTLRWMTVGPEWTSSFAPTPQLLGRRAEWAEETYDPTVTPNGHTGPMGDYLPRVSYISREDFEALGASVRPEAVQVWS